VDTWDPYKPHRAVALLLNSKDIVTDVRIHKNCCYNNSEERLKQLDKLEKAIKSLIDKLHADQRNITLDDQTPPTRERLKTLGNEELYKVRKQLAEEIDERAGSGGDK
jgi:glutamyl-tRNA reductase